MTDELLLLFSIVVTIWIFGIYFKLKSIIKSIRTLQHEIDDLRRRTSAMGDNSGIHFQDDR